MYNHPGPPANQTKTQGGADSQPRRFLIIYRERAGQGDEKFRFGQDWYLRRGAPARFSCPRPPAILAPARRGGASTPGGAKWPGVFIRLRRAVCFFGLFSDLAERSPSSVRLRLTLGGPPASRRISPPPRRADEGLNYRRKYSARTGGASSIRDGVRKREEEEGFGVCRG